MPAVRMVQPVQHPACLEGCSPPSLKNSVCYPSDHTEFFQPYFTRPMIALRPLHYRCMPGTACQGERERLPACLVSCELLRQPEMPTVAV